MGSECSSIELAFRQEPVELFFLVNIEVPRNDALVKFRDRGENLAKDCVRAVLQFFFEDLELKINHDLMSLHYARAAVPVLKQKAACLWRRKSEADFCNLALDT